MKKKTIKATVSAVSIATAFAGISVVQADEVTATQPNESTFQDLGEYNHYGLVGRLLKLQSSSRQGSSYAM